MNPITLMIHGVPYGQRKVRGDIRGLKQWSECIEQQTKDLEPVRGECFLKVRFLLPPEKFPTDCPFGPDLDNLLKRFLDALNKTLFRNVCGQDSCITFLQAEKERVDSVDHAGAHVEIHAVEGANAVERACALGVSRAWAAELTEPREDIYTPEDGEPINGTR
jgi:Holliday junction resolvase RusA-like endonuclease